MNITHKTISARTRTPTRLSKQARQPALAAGHHVSGLTIGGPTSQLIALIDDASRVLCHGEFFFEENTDSYDSKHSAPAF